VVIDPSLSCGVCRWCRSGDYQTCALGGSVGLASAGGLAEYAEVPVAQLVRVPDGVPTKVAALAEPLAVGLHAARRGAVEPGDRVLVTGAGFVGMAAMLGAFSCGAAEVYVSEPDASRREQALAVGATAAFDPGAVDLRREVFLATNRIGPDVVIDATGRPDVVGVGIRSARRGGRIVMAGLSELPLECDIRQIVLYERSIVGSLGSKREIARVLDLVADGRFDPSPLISATYPLDEGASVIASLAASPSGHVKVLVSP
jgi:(R,R)-butanediol dehydrogenase/meso-butanediol dehydrogenase/diacetyl reductase